MASGKNLEKAKSFLGTNSYLPNGAKKYCIHGSHEMFIEDFATALDEARSEAIEESAKVAESRFADQFGSSLLKTAGDAIAEAIRKLKEKP